MKRVLALALLLVSISLCIAWWTGIAAAESEEAGQELETYFSNANTTGGLANVNIIDPIEGPEICAMIYVFDTAQDMQACCGCPITAEGLLTLSISGNLAPNPVGSTAILMDGSIRVLASTTNAAPPPPGDSLFPGETCDPHTFRCCDPGARSGALNVGEFEGELVAWAGHIQGSQITESEFLVDPPDYTGPISEIVEDPVSLPEACAAITQLGSGAGVCTCPLGESSTTGPTSVSFNVMGPLPVPTRTASPTPMPTRTASPTPMPTRTASPTPMPTPTATATPQSKDDCKNGGWQTFGFRNQGQCIQFVNDN
jgi:hypothetical protein